jgi:hypothetical protein
MSRDRDDNIIPLRPDAAGDYAQRQQRLFDWAQDVLDELGLVEAIAKAKSIEELPSHQARPG